MYSKIFLNLSDCFCESNNFSGDNVSANNMNKSSGASQGSSSRTSSGYQSVDETPIKREIRKEEVMAIRTRFPNKIPVIVQKYWKENMLPQLDKSKFLVPQDITMSQFQTIIRNRMRMTHNQALYLLVNERSMLSLSLTLGEVYTEHAGPNGFLYITYASQEVFGQDSLATGLSTQQHNNVNVGGTEEFEAYDDFHENDIILEKSLSASSKMVPSIQRISARSRGDLIRLEFS